MRGKIPKEIGKMVSLKKLALKGNNFSGVLPPEIVELKKMEWMYLSSNKFSGKIPEGFSKMMEFKYYDESK